VISLVDKATIDRKKKIFVHESNIAAAAFRLSKSEIVIITKREPIYMYIYIYV